MTKIIYKKYGFIYITTNLINNKKYIGKKVYDRNSKNYLGSGKILLKAIKKYGKENFKREIIEECNNSKELCLREKYWINFYNATKSREYYNISSGGDGGDWFSNASKEKQEKFKKIKRLQQFGKKHSNETKKKISNSNKGKIISQKSKNKMKISQSLRDKKTYFHKQIKQFTMNEEYIRTFNSIREANIFLNKKLNNSHISACCKGKRKSAFGYIWKYA